MSTSYASFQYGSGFKPMATTSDYPIASQPLAFLTIFPYKEDLLRPVGLVNTYGTTEG